MLYDKISGEIIEIFDPPTGKTDVIAIQHDVDYSVCKDDKKMQKQSRQKNGKKGNVVPYSERLSGVTD